MASKQLSKENSKSEAADHQQLHFTLLHLIHAFGPVNNENLVQSMGSEQPESSGTADPEDTTEDM